LTRNHSTVTVSDEVFARPYNEALVHQVIVAFLANARTATRAQKSRGTVSHSTKKPWRQKGTGRARSGMTSSPLWRGGGRTFPNVADENFTHKVNRKMYKGCMASIFSELIRSGRLVLVDGIAVATPKTKEIIKVFSSLSFIKALVITDGFEENLYLSMRNLKNYSLIQLEHIDPVSLVNAERVMITKLALAKLEGTLA
jgi:large subunit ribosomal protein L4